MENNRVNRYSNYKVILKNKRGGGDEGQRFEQIRRNIPSFFSQEFKDLLYIGVSKIHFQFKNYLRKYNVTLLEAYRPNLESYVGKYIVINADITKFYSPILRWDVIMWWHGPEHITKEELPSTLMNIEKMAKELVILGCPWGLYKQGAIRNNPYEVHKNHIYPKDLIELGYSVETIGASDHPGSNILAWKVLS